LSEIKLGSQCLPAIVDDGGVKSFQYQKPHKICRSYRAPIIPITVLSRFVKQISDAHSENDGTVVC
jgi:hypothetical protein